jgi:hypothetical protein
MAKGVSFRRFIIVDDSTISETRDRQEEKRPRKRARVESVASDSDNEEPNTKNSNHIANGWSSLTPSDSEKPGERDALYYLDDPTATCIFRVGDVLFKVSFSSSNHQATIMWYNVNQIHQEIFECSQFMKDLLKDHLGTNGSTSDDNPLLFRLATPQESRALLWALYTK